MLEYAQMKNRIQKVFKNRLFVPLGFLFFAFALIAALIIEHPEILSTTRSPKPTPHLIIDEFDLTIPTEVPTPTTEIEEVAENDPIVQCQLRECGTIEMKSSVCSLSGCCVIGNQYKVMTDQAECGRLQNEYSKNTGNQYNSSQKDLILKNAQNNANYFGFQACQDQVKQESDRCLDQCLDESYEGGSICRAGMDNLDWDTARYSECLNEVSAIHDQCGDNCLSTSQSKGNECLEKYKTQ